MPGAVVLNAGPITEYIPRPFEKPGHGFVGPQQGTTGERDNGVQFFLLERWLTETLGSVECGGCAYILDPQLIVGLSPAAMAMMKAEIVRANGMPFAVVGQANPNGAAGALHDAESVKDYHKAQKRMTDYTESLRNNATNLQVLNSDALKAINVLRSGCAGPVSLTTTNITMY